MKHKLSMSLISLLLVTLNFLPSAFAGNDKVINWGNLREYFNFGHVKLEDVGEYHKPKEFNLSFLVEAKGNFHGELKLICYDSDGLVFSEFPAVYKNREVTEDPFDRFWDLHQQDRVSIRFEPHNCSNLKVHFEQK